MVPACRTVLMSMSKDYIFYRSNSLHTDLNTWKHAYAFEILSNNCQLLHANIIIVEINRIFHQWIRQNSR